MLYTQAEAHSREVFHCEQCNSDFEAPVITWVDVTRTPQARMELLRMEFNVVQCRRCGFRAVADSPFFYEDFEEGVLAAVFPSVPGDRNETETKIRAAYGHYPHLEFFYDRAQLWLFVRLLYSYKRDRSLAGLSGSAAGDARIRKFIRFVKTSPLAIDLREQISDPSLVQSSYDELAAAVASSIESDGDMLH